MADQIIVKFDALEQQRDGPPRPKCSVLFQTPSGTYEGYDCKARHVKITPMAKFTFNADSGGGWTQTADWSPMLLEWIDMV
eukprot:1983698-Pyramimonas_sp.AAC.1